METEFKGTPGPWKVGEYPDNDVVLVLITTVLRGLKIQPHQVKKKPTPA